LRGWLMLLAFAACPAWAQVSVEQPWSRATPPGATIGVGFMRLRNAGTSAVRVIGASSADAGRVEMHVTVRDGDVMRMRHVGEFSIPAGGVFELKPGGAHLMLVELARPLNRGDRLWLTLVLDPGGDLRVELPVEALGARRPAQPR